MHPRAITAWITTAVAILPSTGAFAPSQYTLSSQQIHTNHNQNHDIKVNGSTKRLLTSIQATKGFGSNTGTDNGTSSLQDKERQKSIDALQQWAKDVGILRTDVKVASGNPIIGGGLGLLTTNQVSSNSLLLQVPTHLTFSASSSKLDSDPLIESFFFYGAKAYNDAPWWAKLSVDLFVCDRIDSTRSKTGKSGGGAAGSNGNSNGDDCVEMRPWLDSLPRDFDTPVRWTKEERDALQYQPLVSMIEAQEKKYTATFDELKKNIDPESSLGKSGWTYDDFLWGCDCARSRAFSGTYGGSAFDPKPYAFTLLLVAAYLGLHLGTMEQASNGAGLVFCGSILKDFVFPKLLKSKKYIICPFIDMANHVGMKEDGNVAFEYFADGYSLSSLAGASLDKGKEVFITYGPRSNDALLQQYGFVEQGNAHDVYIMPPLREWDIGALEEACGRTFQPGRLQKLERAGLLGGKSLGNKDTVDNENDDQDAFEEGVANRGRGVVVTRAAGIDPAILTALRVLVSSKEEWEAVGEAVGNLVTENSGGKENERLARVAAQKALELELESKPTSLEQDEETWSKKDSLGLSSKDLLALQFRIEKKKVLKETIFALSLM